MKHAVYHLFGSVKSVVRVPIIQGSMKNSQEFAISEMLRAVLVNYTSRKEPNRILTKGEAVSLAMHNMLYNSNDIKSNLSPDASAAERSASLKEIRELNTPLIEFADDNPRLHRMLTETSHDQTALKLCQEYAVYGYKQILGKAYPATDPRSFMRQNFYIVANDTFNLQFTNITRLIATLTEMICTMEQDPSKKFEPSRNLAAQLNTKIIYDLTTTTFKPPFIMEDLVRVMLLEEATKIRTTIGAIDNIYKLMMGDEQSFVEQTKASSSNIRTR